MERFVGQLPIRCASFSIIRCTFSRSQRLGAFSTFSVKSSSCCQKRHASYWRKAPSTRKKESTVDVAIPTKSPHPLGVTIPLGTLFEAHKSGFLKLDPNIANPLLAEIARHGSSLSHIDVIAYGLGMFTLRQCQVWFKPYTQIISECVFLFSYFHIEIAKYLKICYACRVGVAWQAVVVYMLGFVNLFSFIYFHF